MDHPSENSMKIAKTLVMVLLAAAGFGCGYSKPTMTATTMPAITQLDPPSTAAGSAALTVAALYEKASDDEQTGWRDLLTAHEQQLREWAEIYPTDFRRQTRIGVGRDRPN